MKPDTAAPLSPLAMLIAEGASEEELQAYFAGARHFEVYLENTLLPTEELTGIMEFLEVAPIFEAGTITLHGDGSGISELERRRIEADLRATLGL